MEPSKKRRNSILKKKSAEEDTTTEIKARRISFSGKKSVKEFIAGEEAETIWGTSYEESADDLKVSSSESGLVNVHVKRIQLRNRKVICEPQQQKRRPSLKKKVLIAENDKENLCVKSNPPPVEIAQEVKTPLPLVRLEQPQSKSPVKSELAMGKIEENVSKSQEAMPPKKLVVDCSSICSSTFDFINFSAQINKTITIEQSLDVSLNESELQMFKFRVPVTASEISPNTSNVLCKSILMSEDDVNVLKMVRKKKGGINMIKEQIMDEELNLIETKKRDAGVTMSKTNVEETIIQYEKSVDITAGTASHSMEISHIHDGKGSKRKSERTPHSVVLDCTLLEMNSPMRKKPMHTLNCSSMDETKNIIVNSSQNEPNTRPTIYEPVAVDESICVYEEKTSGRPTIHFDSVAVEESAAGMHSLSGTNTLSHTIFDSKTINENSSFPNTTAACLALGNQTDGISMELSMCTPRAQKNTKSNAQTIYFSPLGEEQYSVHMNVERFDQSQPLSIVKSSQTIYDSADVDEITVPSTQVTKNSKKQRKSIYTSFHMDEETPKPTKTFKTKGLKLRQTILTPKEIIEDIPRDIDRISILQKTIITPINIFEDSIQAEPDTIEFKKQRHTIYDPVEIKEDIQPSQQAIMYSNKNKGKRESIYTPTDMVEESPKPNETKTASIIGFNPEDTIEDIPTTSLLQKTTKAPVDIFEDTLELGTSSKPSVPNRQTIFESEKIDVDAVPHESSSPLYKKNKVRESIYTPSDMIEDSPNRTLPSEGQSKRIISSSDVKTRHTIFTPVDIIEDLPKEITSKNVLHRTTETSIDMLEDSVQAETVCKATANNGSLEIEKPVSNMNSIRRANSFKSSEIVYSHSEMIMECSKTAPSHKAQTSQASNSSNCLKTRQTIFTLEDIIDDSIKEFGPEEVLQKTTRIPINIFEDSLELEPSTKLNDIADIEAASEPIRNPNVSSKINKSRESIYTPSDMIEDSPKSTQPIRVEAESYGLNKRHTIFTPENIVEDLPKEFPSKNLLQRTNKKSSISIFSEYSQAQPAIEKIAKNRQTIHDSADIEEVTVPIPQGVSSFNTKSNPVVQNRKTIYDTVDIEEATCSIKPGIPGNKNNASNRTVHVSSDIVEEYPMCSESQKQQSSTKDIIKTCQSIFTSEDIMEDTIKETKATNLLQKTIKTPFNIFEDSLQEENPLKQSVKNRQTIYDIADIEEDKAPNQHGKSVSLINKSRKSINVPSEIIVDDLEETKPIQDNAKVSKPSMQNDSTKSNVKRQTTYNQVDISLDSGPQISHDLEVKKNEKQHTTIHIPTDIVEDLPKAIKQRAPSKIQVFRRELSSTDLNGKKPMQPGEILQNVAVNSNQTHCASKPPQFSFAVHQANLKKRKSIHTPVDMVEDSPKPIPPSNPKVIVRKTVYTTCGMKSDSPLYAQVEKIHQQTIKNQTDIVIDSPATITDKSLEKNNRQTIHTPLEMTEDSPKLKINTSKVSVEPEEIKKNIQERDEQLEKGSNLQFRKPTKLFAETFKSLESPYSSTKSLMDKVMQDMGYSMNFQLQFPPEATSQELSQSNRINSEEELYPSMKLSVPQLSNETTSVDNSMELSIASDTNSKKPKPQTMCLSEAIEMEVANHIQSETNQLYKTSFDDSLMDMSIHDAAINAQKKLDYQKTIGLSVNLPKSSSSQQLSQFIDETMNKKSANQSNLIVPHHSSKSEFDNQKPKPFEIRATSGSQITDNSMSLSILKSHNSWQQNKQPQILRESAFTRQTSHVIDIASETCSYYNMEIQCDEEESLPKAPLTRQTIHFNQDLDVEDINENAKSLLGTTHNEKGEDKPFQHSRYKMPPSSQTMLVHQDLEIEDMADQHQATAEVSTAQVHNYPCRKTIHCYEDLEQSSVASVNRQAIGIVELNKENASPQESRRKTVLLNEDLELEGIYARPDTSLKGPLQRFDRQTMNLSENIEEVEEAENQQRSSNKQLSFHDEKQQSRKTILMNQDLDISELDESQKVPAQIPSHATKSIKPDDESSQVIPERPTRQTINFNRDLALCEIEDSLKISPQIPSQDYIKPNRGTNYLNKDLEVDKRKEVDSQVVPQRSNRQTIHFNQDLDICEMDDSPKIPPQIRSQDSIKSNRGTNYLDQDLEVDKRQEIDSQVVPQRSNRQTIHFNQNLDLSEIDDLQKVSPQIPTRGSVKTNRQTKTLNQDLGIDECFQEVDTQVIPPNRQTIHFNQDIERDDDQHFAPQYSKSLNQYDHRDHYKRQTILVSQELDMSISPGEQSLPPNKAHQNVGQNFQESGPRTINFQQELEIEDPNNTDRKRNKSSLHQEIESEDEFVKQKKLFNETKKNTEENAYRPLIDKCDLDNKPEFISTRNHQTINFTNNNGLDEIVEAAATGDDNTMNPSIANRNCLKEGKEVSAKFVSKPRRVTICDAQPLDMDESSMPKSTARKSSFSRTLNFDEVPTKRTEKSTSDTKSKAAWQSTSKDDESPIYNPNLRPKCPMTPSEVDKSLAEYLKVEAATEYQEEEIFYDAEDGYEENERQNKRQTCHVAVNILEESGMQPLQSHGLKRQTTFSPKEMSNESLDHTQFKLANLHNEIRQDASDNRMQKQSLDGAGKGLFQKSLELKDIMEVTQIHESSNNSKQILMEPQSGINFDGVQKNRQTLHFSESINIADVSSAWKPSSAVQSVKELLLENTRLFSQSNLMQPIAFEKKRSTVFFAGHDDSMDVSCIDSGPTDPESTPTKNKTSRIPQLIGSAKKLESLKKSMEFIQQELPNIGCHLRNKENFEDIDDSLKDQETPRRFSISIPKKLKRLAESFEAIELSTNKTEESPQQVVRQLQESFDTIDIPRKVLSTVRKTIESPQRDARELEEPYDADEIRGRAINVDPRTLQESFETVEIPRRGTTFQRNDTLNICPNEKETTINASQKSLFQFEDPPITISDVSTFFSQKLLPNAKQTYSPNTTEALCKLNVNEIQALSRSPDSEDITHNLAHFKKRFVELTCDSITLSDSRDNIEKTHLSLVNSFDDESEMVHSQPQIQIAAESAPPAKEKPLKPNSSVCRKCKCQRLSITHNDTTIGSFMLEPLPVYKVDLSQLEQLAKKPNISDVGKVWRQKIRESDSFNVSDGSRSMAMDDEDSESIEKLLMELAEERLANAQYRQQKRKEIKIENSFLYKVRRKMQSKSNWIINDLLLFNNVIALTHTRIRTFAILINFTPKDPRGVEVVFDDIQFKPNILHTRQWKPIEYALHYQLLVDLPFDLKKICPTSEHFFDLLEHVDKVTEDVLRTGKEMLSLVLPSPASLIREPSGRLYIRKYVRTKTLQNDVKRTEIHIEVRNIKKLSYESIAMPPLYEFDENIQLLPVGNDFLRKFLSDPLKFIKT